MQNASDCIKVMDYIASVYCKTLLHAAREQFFVLALNNNRIFNLSHPLSY